MGARRNSRSCALGQRGLWKCRGCGKRGKPKAGFPLFPRAPWKSRKGSEIPTAPTTTAVEKWKSKSRISTFPPRLAISQKVKKRGRLRLFSLHPTKNGRSPAHWINLQLSHQDSSSEEISHSTAG